MTKLTPMMQQYQEIKAHYQDAILFYRMGDFYEMFAGDAVVAARILGIALTTRDKGRENPVPMCGIPYHSASSYISRLILAGHKVAICEQGPLEDGAKGLVPREVKQVITPGLIVDDTHLSSDKANYLMAVYQRARPEAFGVAFLDISTGDFRVTEITGREDFLGEVRRVCPSEILVAQEGLALDEWYLTRLQTDLDEREAEESVLNHFHITGLGGLGLKGHPAALMATAMVLAYVRATQQETLPHITRLRYYNPGTYLILGANTTRNLELFESIGGGRQGTLVAVMNQTVTPMGARLLADWIAFPLMDHHAIGQRLDAVEEILSTTGRLHGLREALREVPDLERIMGRISANRASPRDMVSLAGGLEQAPLIRGLLEGSLSTLLDDLAAGLDPCDADCARIRRTIVEDPPLKLGEGGVIAEGVDAELDELRHLRRDSREWIAALETQERSQTGIGSLKIGYNRVFGYYIEVGKAHAHKIPQTYLRRQTLTNAERYITPELKEYEARLLGAQEAITRIEQRIFQELREALIGSIPVLQRTVSAIASLDVLAGLAQLARTNAFCRPQVHPGRDISIRGGRHPVIERMLKAGEFVPNHFQFDAQNDTLHIITGPNMAGKSTYMRQIALITLMAQMGSFVPAQTAVIGVVDRIFTRIGALDNLCAGQSTFLVEMSETADILNNATERSLVILDEIGRGTSTFDGMSLAWAVAEHLDQHRMRTLFATHYHELADLARRHKGIKNYHMAVDDSGLEVVFLREVKRGAVGKSYGIHVARMAGIPEEVVASARVILENLGRKGKSVPALFERLPVQAGLFEQPDDGILKEIRELDIENLRPVEALTLLNTYKERILKTCPKDPS